MESYYLNEKGIIKTEMLEALAENEAKKLSNATIKKKDMTTTQLRKFFNEVKALEKRLRDNGDSDEYFNKIMPLVKMLKAKIYYSSGRENVTKEFEEFILSKIDKVRDKNDFKAFVLHFEAVVGYFYRFKNLSKR
jgi:CRISPR-associated protein Csm2